MKNIVLKLARPARRVTLLVNGSPSFVRKKLARSELPAQQAFRRLAQEAKGSSYLRPQTWQLKHKIPCASFQASRQNHLLPPVKSFKNLFQFCLFSRELEAYIRL